MVGSEGRFKRLARLLKHNLRLIEMAQRPQ
jgi:hypothetical protein